MTPPRVKIARSIARSVLAPFKRHGATVGVDRHPDQDAVYVTVLAGERKVVKRFDLMLGEEGLRDAIEDWAPEVAGRLGLGWVEDDAEPVAVEVLGPS